MFLAIYVQRRLGLTVDLTDELVHLPPDASREGPAFESLTADPDNLRDPVRLRHWLEAFLPENNTVAAWRQHARQAWENHGVDADRATAASILWGNTDAEYTGAVDFRRSDSRPPDQLPERAPATLEPLSEQAIGERLELAARIAEAAPRTRPSELLALSGRRSSLSGMRGKIGLRRGPDGNWAVAHGDALNTWIVKHEHRPHLPGEAGVEAICQRTLGLVGIPAATTEARVFDGQQAVVSERTDRQPGSGGRVDARHQEEWIQAACHTPDQKYDRGLGPGPQWPDAYRLLQERAIDPDAETTTLTRVLAATWMLGNGDQHRRNLGFLHGPADTAPAVSLAPLYDASSAAGTRYDKGLAVGMEGVSGAHRITPVRWLRHSRACGIPADRTLAMVEDLFRTLPDALATARAEARTVDENVSQAHVDQRVDATIRYVQARERAYRQQLRRAARRGMLQG